jgi:hypothetical protein
MRASSLVAASVLVVAALVGCGSTTTESPTGGSTTSTTGTGGGGAPECNAVPGECGQCLYTECQESYCACYANPDCAALGTCLNTCDPADPNYNQCVQDCQTQYPQGIADAALVGSCSDQNCQPQCPATGVTLGPCEECLLTNCNDEMQACLADPDCQAIIDCAQACPMTDPNNPNCPIECAQMHPGGAAEAGAVINCSQDSCTNECPTG